MILEFESFVASKFKKAHIIYDKHKSWVKGYQIINIKTFWNIALLRWSMVCIYLLLNKLLLNIIIAHMKICVQTLFRIKHNMCML